MKLTTNKIIDLFKALTELRGAPTLYGKGENQQVIHTPYPLSEKVKWNAAKNRAILKRLVVASDELQQDAMTDLNLFKRQQREGFASESDPKAKAEKMMKAREIVQEKIDEMNAEALKIGRMEQDVEGLLLMPAKGFCLKTSSLPPTVLSELLELIDGDPEFEPESPSEKP